MKTKLNLVVAVLLSGWVMTSTSCQKDDNLVPSESHGMVFQGGDIQPLSYENDLNDDLQPGDTEPLNNQWGIGSLTHVTGTVENFDGHQGVVTDPGMSTSEEVLVK